MRLHPCFLTSAVAIAVTCVVSAAAYYYKSRSSEINEVMVFCKLQYNAYNCFDKLISYIENAKRCVNVCMPGIQNPAIQGRLVKLLKTRKVLVRIIIDRSGFNKSTDFLIKELVDAGAEIRCKVNERVYSVQHKFCLVDDEILMTGTLNWGNDRSSDHWNYVYITSKSQLVQPVKMNFYLMWAESSSDMGDLEQISDFDTVDIQDEINDNTNNHVKSDDILTFRETQTTPELYIV